MDIFQTIEQEIHSVLSQIEEKDMQAALDELQKNRRVFVDGEGRSGLMAKGFAMRLMHLGYTAYVVGETITPALKSGDLFIGVSGSGTSPYVVGDAAKAQKAGCRVLAVTSKADSPLAQSAHCILRVPGTIRGDAGTGRGSVQLLSTLFDQSVHIVLDALCLLCSRRDATANDTATGMHW